MYKYEFSEFLPQVKELAITVQQDFEPAALLAVARGGLTLTHALSTCLDNRFVYSLNSCHYEDTQVLNDVQIWNIPDLSQHKKVLVVDDICDSGDSLIAILAKLKRLFPNTEFKSAVVFWKEKSKMAPDFYIKRTSEWIEFFWDVRLDEGK